MSGILRLCFGAGMSLSLGLVVFAPSLYGRAPEPAIPKVERVKPLAPDPIASAPGVFFFEDLETMTDLKERFQDQGTDEGRFRISDVDPFSGKKSIQQTYKPLSEFAQGADPGSAGWVWRFFGDNPNGQPEPRGKYPTVVARWYHKFEEGFTPRDDKGFPPKMARMRCFKEGAWEGVYTVLFWIEDADGHLSIERHTRAPGAHREWPPNHECQWKFSDPMNVGRWIHFELRVALGEGPRSDRVQAWADGTLVCDVAGDDLAAGYKDFLLNGMSWDCYWNGGSPVKQSRFYDDLALSTEPIGPARTSANPVIVKSTFQGAVEGDRQQSWEVEVAQAAQKPLVVDHTSDGVVTRYQPAEFEYTVVWKGTVSGEGNEVQVSKGTGQFAGPLAGKDGLSPNTLHMVRVRQQDAGARQPDAGGNWSAWSPWHAAFATTWAEGTAPEKRTPPRGYLLGHAAQ
jgi:hypothetical protein